MKKRTQTYQKREQKRSSLLPRLIILALVIISSLAIFVRMSALQDSLSITPPTTKANAAENDASSTPTFLRIPSINVASVIKNTSDTTDYTLTRYTTPAKQVMNTHIIYSKNTNTDFIRIADLQKGDAILLITQDGAIHIYTVVKNFSATFSTVLLYEDDALYLTTKPLFPFMKQPVIKAIEEE